MNKLTKREIWMLHTLLDIHIARYLMCITFGRKDASERADRHILISKLLCRFILGEGDEFDESKVVINAWKKVHDYLAEHLTDRLDEVIEYPIDKTLYGTEYDWYAARFFEEIIRRYSEIEAIVKEFLTSWKAQKE